MHYRTAVLTSLFLTIALSSARGADFADSVNLAPLESIESSTCRRSKRSTASPTRPCPPCTIASGLDGHSALYTVLDISFRPEAYADQNIIKIRNVPLRQDFLRLQNVDPAELQRIVHDGMVPPNFLASDPVQALLRDVQATAVYKAEAVNQVVGASNNVNFLAQPDMPLFPPFRPGSRRWHLAQSRRDQRQCPPVG